MPTPVLTHDERKAAEAAFRNLPCDPQWSASAKAVYEGIVKAMRVSEERPFVADEEPAVSAR